MPRVYKSAPKVDLSSYNNILQSSKNDTVDEKEELFDEEDLCAMEAETLDAWGSHDIPGGYGNDIDNIYENFKCEHRTEHELSKAKYLSGPPDESSLFDDIDVCENDLNRDGTIKASFDEEGAAIMKEKTSRLKPLSNYSEMLLRDFSGIPRGTIQVIDSNLKRINWTQTSPIQSVVIPAAVDLGLDILGIAKTGCGKTGAYLLSIILKLLKTNNSNNGINNKKCSPKALILAPTRELVEQIQLVSYRLTHGLRMKIRIITSGGSWKELKSSLDSTVDVVIATPRRLLDTIENGLVTIDSVKVLVLDEIDRLVSSTSCYVSQMNEIINNKGLPSDRQTLVFTATYPKRDTMESKIIDDITKKGNRLRIEIGATNLIPNNIEQNIIESEEEELYNGKRLEKLMDVVEKEKQKGNCSNGKTMIIFTNDFRQHFSIKTAIQNKFKDTLRVLILKGKSTPEQRQNTFKSFKNGEADILISSDVAQRGLDFVQCGVVVNYDFVKCDDEESYKHRVGRTGRKGNKGVSYSFVYCGMSSNVVNSIIASIKGNNGEVPEFLITLNERTLKASMNNASTINSNNSNNLADNIRYSTRNNKSRIKSSGNNNVNNNSTRTEGIEEPYREKKWRRGDNIPSEYNNSKSNN